MFPLATAEGTSCWRLVHAFLASAGYRATSTSFVKFLAEIQTPPEPSPMCSIFGTATFLQRVVYSNTRRAAADSISASELLWSAVKHEDVPSRPLYVRLARVSAHNCPKRRTGTLQQRSSWPMKLSLEGTSGDGRQRRWCVAGVRTGSQISKLFSFKILKSVSEFPPFSFCEFPLTLNALIIAY